MIVKISAAMQRSQVPPVLRNDDTRKVKGSVVMVLKMDSYCEHVTTSPVDIESDPGQAQVHWLVIVGLL
jgi:hypothetical protein